MTPDPGQRAHRAAVTNMRRGDACRWRAAFACAVVVGRYERGATLALAHDLRRSADTVERMARAAVTYLNLHLALRGVAGVPQRLRKLRRELPYTHWATIGAKMQNDMSPLEAFAQLDTAALGGAGAESLGSNGRTPPSLLDALDTLMAKWIQAAERLPPDSPTRRNIERGVEWFRQARQSAESEGLE